MKAVKCIAVFFLITCCLSCIKTVESLEIIILNRTDSVLYISLYPKEGPGSYRKSDRGSGWSYTEFTLRPNNDYSIDWDAVLFHSSDLNIEPYKLASKMFDSIYISLTNKDNVIIKFTPEKVNGYSENIFSEASTWEYRKQTDHRNQPVIDHCYYFLILKNKMIFENDKKEDE